MAARGRGRGGWRGGRSGGRGGMQAPALRDDEGNFVEVERNEGPPPLFPAVELKSDPPEPTPQDKLLLLRRTDLKRYYKGSPYYIEPRADAAAAGSRKAGGADEIERYSDKFNKRSVTQQQKPPLATILTLHPHYFPEELFSDKDKRLAARGARAGSDLFKRAPASADASSVQQHLDSLAAREQEKGPGVAGAEGPAAAAAGEGEHPEDEAVAVDDEDDDDVMQEDDYYQGEYFDDDEGYDDYDDGGGDDGAIY